MAGKASKQKGTAINIKALPVQMHIGSQKYINDDWGTMAYIIDRREIQNKFTDPELRYNCIYFLFGYENTTEMCYVGQAKKRNSGESVLARLREHDQSTTEKYSEVWDWAVVVTNKNDSWTLDDLNALENIFYSEIPAEQRLNGNTPNAGGADFDEYDDKTNQIKALISAIGFSIFTEKTEVENIQVTSETNEFSIVEDLQNGMARIPEIVTPHKVVKAMVDMLPDEVWNSHTVFLDPACKGGEYLREIYDRLMDNELLQSEFPNTIERSNHILNNQIYGIALSQVSLERTTKKLLGFGNNIKIIPNYIDVLKVKFNNSEEKKKYIKEKLKEAFGKEMTFDVVIGNPPYQEDNSTSGRQSKPLYDKFIDMGIKTTDRLLSFVTNNTFLTNDSKSKLRDDMIEAGLVSLNNYPISGEMFNGVGVSVCTFLIDKLEREREFTYTRIENGSIVNTYTSRITKGDIIAESKYELDIPRKLQSDSNLGDIVLGDKAFGIASNGRIGFTGKSGFVDISTIEIQQGVVIKNKIYGFEDNDYIKYEDIPKGKEYVNKTKVICPREITKTSLTAFDKAEILPVNCICTENWTVMGAFDNINDAYNYIKYIKTKVFKFISYVYSSTGMTKLTKVLLSHIPLQDFTSNSDIDWSQSISDIDQQLYKKYNLKKEEIDYIEKIIKSIE